MLMVRLVVELNWNWKLNMFRLSCQHVENISVEHVILKHKVQIESNKPSNLSRLDGWTVL